MNIKKTLSTLFILCCFFTNSQAQQADLIIKELEVNFCNEAESCSDSLAEWFDTCILVTIKNRGKATSDTTTLYVWNANISLEEGLKIGITNLEKAVLKENDELNLEDNTVGIISFEKHVTIPPIKKGKSISILVTIQEWCYSPNCEVGAKIDPENKIKETNEDNNTKYFFEGG